MEEPQNPMPEEWILSRARGEIVKESNSSQYPAI